jgi:AraC family transcriptional regulator
MAIFDYLQGRGLEPMNFQLRANGFKILKIDEKNWQEEPHSHHNMYQISIPVAGQLNVGLENRIISVRPGQLIVTHPSLTHWHQTGENTSAFLLIGIERELLQSIQQNCDFNPVEIEFETFQTIDISAFQKFLVKKIINDLWFHSSEHLKVEEISLTFSKYILSILKGDFRSYPNLFGSRTEIKRVIDYLETMYAEEIKLEDLAEMAKMSKYYFIRLFQKETGKTPYQYLQEVRFKRAVDLIIHTQKSVTEIAGLVGLSQNGLQKLFRYYTGSSPSSYRKLNEKTGSKSLFTTG